MVSNPKNIKKRATVSDSFLEALRDLSGGKQEETGDLRPNQALNLERRRQFNYFNQEIQNIRRQEKLVWTKQEQETKLQIAVILEELKKLAKSVKQLDRHVEIAAVQAPVEPGVYHVGFFEALKQTIILFRKKAEESINWLTTFNQRAQKRNHFWGQFKKSGTKFLLSQERYMSTQAG